MRPDVSFTSVSNFARRKVQFAVVAAVALIERVLFGSLFVVVLSIVVLLAFVIADNGSAIRNLHRAFLLVLGSLGLAFVLLPRIGIHVNTWAVQLFCFVTFIVLLVVVGRKSPESVLSSRVRFTQFVGAGVIVAMVTVAWWRLRGLSPWAMSGDARNHIRIIRETIDYGGLKFPGYPGLANGVTGIFGGWQFDLSAQRSADLAVEIRLLAVSATVFLVAASVMAGQLVASSRSATLRRPIFLGTALLTLLPISQVWLYTYLYEGFVPTALALATALAVFVELCRESASPRWLVTLALAGALVLALTYPPLVPMILAAAASGVLVALLSQWGRVAALAVAWVPVATGCIAYGVLRLEVVRTYTRRNLDLPGRITPVESWAVPMLVAVSVVLVFALRCRHRVMSTAVLSFGVVAVIMDRFLDETLDQMYYLDKTRWLVCAVLLALNTMLCVRVVDEVRELAVQMSSGIALLGLCLVAVAPIIQPVPRWPIALTMLETWTLPTPSEAQMIEEANSRAPASVFWRVSPDFLSTQVMDIWLTVGFDPTESNISWGYRSDVFSIEQVCQIAAENAPATIWVVSAEAQAVAKYSCDRQGVTIEVLD